MAEFILHGQEASYFDELVANVFLQSLHQRMQAESSKDGLEQADTRSGNLSICPCWRIVAPGYAAQTLDPATRARVAGK